MWSGVVELHMLIAAQPPSTRSVWKPTYQGRDYGKNLTLRICVWSEMLHAVFTHSILLQNAFRYA